MHPTKQLGADISGPSREDLAFKVRFWGTRGSIATPGMNTVRYGGNTPCTEIRVGEHILILDAGTGIRELGGALQKEFQSRPLKLHILIGHTHWDHIQGFPFFLPAFVPGNTLRLYSSGKPLQKLFGQQMEMVYFPVPLSQLKARLEFIDLVGPIAIGPITVSFERLNHPGAAVGFRLFAANKTVVYLSDHERFSRNCGDTAGAAEDLRIENFAKEADLLICEAQYTEEEYAQKKGWGHSTFDDALHLAGRAQVRRLAIFHHDPTHDDDFMDRVIEECRRKARAAGYPLQCFGACEGQTLVI